MRRLTTLLLSAAVLTLSLGACGRMGNLKPKTGVATVPVAAGAKRAATAEELITPSTQSRPKRNVDILYRSERRTTDEYDIPPGPKNGRED